MDKILSVFGFIGLLLVIIPAATCLSVLLFTIFVILSVVTGFALLAATGMPEQHTKIKTSYLKLFGK